MVFVDPDPTLDMTTQYAAGTPQARMQRALLLSDRLCRSGICASSPDALELVAIMREDDQVRSLFERIPAIRRVSEAA